MVAFGQMTLLAAAAHAQVWRHELTVNARALATDNSRAGEETPTGEAPPRTTDLLLTLEPGWRVTASGPQLNLRMDSSVRMVDAVRDTVRRRVEPRVDATAAATLVPQLLFLDASASVRQVESDPFGARVTDASTENRQTSQDYRLAPMLRWRFAPRAELFARHEESWLTNTSAASGSGGGADLRGHRTTLRLEREPVPLGAAVELDRHESLTETDTRDLRIRTEAVRLQASYALSPADLVLGVVVGRERGRSADLRFSDQLYGVAVRWAPSTRTDIAARIEHRFFGTGGRLDGRLRSPMSSLSLHAFRDLASTSTLGRATAATDAALLAAAVAAPPAGAAPAGSAEEGAAPAPVVVPPRSAGEEALGRRGFPMALPGVIDITAGYPQLETGVDARWVLLGRRHSVTFAAYSRSSRQITEGITGVLPPSSEDSRQTGGSVSVTRRLTPMSSLDFSLAASRIEGQGARAGDLTREGEVSITWITQLGPRTTFTTGVAYEKFHRVRAALPGVNSSETHSLSAGISHRF